MMIAQYARKVITCTEILVLQIAQHFSTHSKEYVITAMKTVKNVLATQQTNVRLVRRVTIFNLMPLLVNKPAQQHTTLMITAGHVNPVMLPVRNVQIRWIILALSVNQITIFNLITLLVNKPAQQHTTSRIATGHVNPVMLPVRNVQVRTIILALSVNKDTICNLIIRLALLVAPRHPTTPIVAAKNVSHVMQPVKFVLARQIIALLVMTRFICNMTL